MIIIYIKGGINLLFPQFKMNEDKKKEKIPLLGRKKKQKEIKK